MSSDSASFQPAEPVPPDFPTLNLNKDASIEEETSNPNPNPNLEEENPNPNTNPNPALPKKRGRKKKEVPIEAPPKYLFKFQEEEDLSIKSDQTEPNQNQNQIKFKIGDLVWGKVRSHPWWPGQIYDPSLASEPALKIKKNDHFLVAYFGDKSFAWIEASSLQPYQSTFPKMEKQSSVESFVTAVDSSLGEVSRRVELAFACNCTHKRALKEGLVQNAGIIDGTHLPETDNSVILESFNTEKMINYMQEKTVFGAESFNRLEFVMARAYLKAFDKFRGFPDGPEFVYFEEFGNNPNKISENSETAKKRKKETETQTSGTPKKRGRPKKSKPEFSDEEYDPKSQSDEKIKKRGRPKKSKEDSEEDSEEEDFTSESEEKPKIKKRGRPKKAVESDFTSESEEKTKIKKRGRPKKAVESYFTSESKEKPKIKKRGRPKKSKRVEKRVDFSDEEYSPQSNKPKTLIKHNSDNTSSSKKRGRPKKESFPVLPAVLIEYPSCSELLAQLSIAAQDPVNKDYKFITQLLEFFSQYKNCNLVSTDLFGEITKSGRRVCKPKFMKDSYWTDVVLDTGSDEDQNENGDLKKDKDVKNNENENLGVNSDVVMDNVDDDKKNASLVEDSTSDAAPAKEEKDEGKKEEMQVNEKVNE